MDVVITWSVSCSGSKPQNLKIFQKFSEMSKINYWCRQSTLLSGSGIRLGYNSTVTLKHIVDIFAILFLCFFKSF